MNNDGNQQQRVPWYKWRFSALILFLFCGSVKAAYESVRHWATRGGEHPFAGLTSGVFVVLAIPALLGWFLWTNRETYMLETPPHRHPETETDHREQEDRADNQPDARDRRSAVP